MTTFLKKALFLAVMVYAQMAAAQTPTDGLTAMQLEDWDKAITIYTALTKANSADQPSFLSLGNAYLAKGDKVNAKESFKAAYTAKPDGALALVANGRVLLMQDDDSQATIQFKKAEKAGRKDVSAIRQIGESYLFYKAPGSTRPNLILAEEWLKKAMDMSSKDYLTLMTLAYTYKEMPRGGDAALHYEFAENIEPKNPLPKLMLAKVYKAAKLPEKFLINVNKAIAVAPTYTPALREKALFLYFARRWDEATLAYKDLIARGTDLVIEDEMQLANCLYVTHDCKGVSELVEKILKKDPSKNYLRRLQAYCDFDNGEFARGLTLLRSYFNSVTPDKVIPSDYEYLGKFLLSTKGDTTEAIANFKNAVGLDSTLWKYHKTNGDLYYTMKDNCNSANSFKMYFDSIPEPKATDAADLYKFGLAQYYCKDDTLRYKNAFKTFLKISELVPTATIGWLWAGKSIKMEDPLPSEIEANPALGKEYGKATPYFEQYVPIAEKDKEKFKKDLLMIYEYLSYVYFVRNEEAKFKEITAKWLELDPGNAKIKEMQEAFGKEMVPTPATPSGGGKG